MTTFSPGLSDSIAGVLDEPRPCPHCLSSSHIAGGLCVGCLLEAGLDPADDAESETLTDILAEVRLPDQNWRLGNYEILEEIGRGGMGVIYRARQRHSRRIVAVKRVLSYHADAHETLARFRREAQAAASLDHPNILPIYEVSESEDGLPFFSMKFAPGGTLQQVGPALRKDPRQCVALVAKVARAVQYAHSRGILHRDLKPGNILLDGRGEPLVSDFGLAKWLDTASDLTRTLTIFGTPGYIAPEQASQAAAELKPTADIYSLGAILFDLLAGRPPFLGAHALSVIREASETTAPKLRTLSKVADRDLETICARCLDRDPKLRYPSAHNVAEDLERWLEGRPIIARRVSPPARTWRWVRRNPKLAASVGVCLILTAATAIWEVRIQQLGVAVQQNEIAVHSVAVLPLLDLDQVQPEIEIAAKITTALEIEFARFGPSRVIAVRSAGPKWTGIGGTDEVRLTAKHFNCRAVLGGTVRQVAGKTRISLHLVDQNGREPLGNWICELTSAGSLGNSLLSKEIGPAMYRALEKQRNETDGDDPVMRNDRARAFFIAGRDLLVRRRTAELERAIGCFEGAIREEPGSIIARSFLAMACMGKDLLSANPELAARALRMAREAVDLAPNNPTANRCLCAVYVSYGMHSEALEAGLRSLEFGDRSERAFGEIAYTWRMRGHPEKAIEWYQKAKASQQQPADYDALLGDCWTDLGVDDEASHHYEWAARLRPDQPDGWAGLCRLKLLRGNTEAARTIYEKEIENYKTSSEAKQIGALIEFFGRNYDQATRLFEDLATVDAMGGGRGGAYGALDYKSALARLKIEAGDKEAARLFLADCIATSRSRLALVPHDAETLYRVAAAEATLGDTASALKDLRAAIESGWIDYRSPRLDPRFDGIRDSTVFETLLSNLATQVAELERRAPAVINLVAKKKPNGE
jgi:tetratricopeptide (TPR) repeat protein/TolB-like protein/tRNA A-37 threonylcarbamoyl transferase component Bud32